MTSSRTQNSALPLPALPILPWVGSEYPKGGMLGKRIVIVGSLSNLWPLDPSDISTATTAMVERHLGARKPSLFWSNLSIVLLGRLPTPAERARLWHSLAVYEYNQVEEKRPHAQYPTRSNQSLFLDTLAALQPALALILGTGVWRALPPQRHLTPQPLARGSGRPEALRERRPAQHARALPPSSLVGVQSTDVAAALSRCP